MSNLLAILHLERVHANQPQRNGVNTIFPALQIRAAVCRRPMKTHHRTLRWFEVRSEWSKQQAILKDQSYLCCSLSLPKRERPNKKITAQKESFNGTV